MTMTSVQDLQMNTDMTAVRFPAWIGLTVTSAICMAAFCSEIDKEGRGSDEKWSLAVYSISMCVAVLSSVAYLFVRGLFVGQIFEMVMVCAFDKHGKELQMKECWQPQAPDLL